MVSSASLHPVAYFAILTVLFAYLFLHHRQRYHVLWTIGWAALLARQLMALVREPSFLTDIVFLLVAGTTVVLGGLSFAGRESVSPRTDRFTALALVVLTAGNLLVTRAIRPDVDLAHAAAFSFLAACWVATGWLLLVSGRHQAPLGASMAGVGLAAWGVLQPVEWVLSRRLDDGRVLFEIDAAFGALLAAGMLVLSLEDTHARTEDAREELEREVVTINRELEQINIELEAANRHQADFLSNTSHELKTPLTSIIANAEILEYEMAGPISDEQRRSIVSIHRNSQHLLHLITQLLEVAREGEGYASLDLEPVAVRSLIDGVVETVHPLIDDTPLQLEVDVDDTLGPCMLDGEKVYRVYLNLVENAIKFSRRGRIVIGARRVDDELEGYVSDEGVGVPEEHRASIFSAFQQADASTTRAYAGVGLGLAICSQTVEAHGGRIWVEPGPEGRGSVFRFRLPIARDEVDPPVS